MSTSAVAPADRRKGVHLALWGLQVLLALFFVAGSALPKLVGEQSMVDLFSDIGIGQWFRYAVGLLELAGAIGLLVPRLAGLAALGLGGVMIGATLTQLVVLGEPAQAGLPIVLLAIAGLVAWGRWPRTRALLGR